MKIASLFRNRQTTTQTIRSWQKWPSCKQPKTPSFRERDDMFKTVNSVFFSPSDGVETPDSWSSEATSFPTPSDDFDGESVEMIVRGVVRSERLFFEPGDTNSILEEAKPGGFPFKESVVLAMESEDPYIDFRRSMEEMVESHSLKDWDCLEELLGWYLRVNGKKNHVFIVGAFVDLLVDIAGSGAGSSCCDSVTSFSSALSSFPSSPLCSVRGRNEEDKTLLP
ncbi:hypothetical protein K2173_024188 [Erythroxylum novogranatense]|uniref:Transcription repressor n=1 Tax=Erythroxylum novogranatense TaxID=1862640 RepID=A0AAV8UFH7_9ROSI|nr:hypothetical protein K2173_024188 [Erythroxylum novogranatense]